MITTKEEKNPFAPMTITEIRLQSIDDFPAVWCLHE